ncbi:hypothetical protein EZV62_010625 [Acer yangbiense]|uniref:hAT-like transposase RNase-H fold domain-containing protein n=1 Tax=Acer yangbiense TaxID=1000413 RepID=A0A5C7I305_9ROSI|nr:hypothetical protein EZV62_010625 [Acer yangbiense]
MSQDSEPHLEDDVQPSNNPPNSSVVEPNLDTSRLRSPSKGDSGKDAVASYAFDQNVAKKKLARMIIMHEYPLSMVEHEAFREFSTALQPAFKSVSRNTIKKEILQIYDVEKMKTISILAANNCRIALTTDLWTASSQRKGYMAVTSHFIDESWCLQSRILRFIYVPCPHTAETICEALHDCVMDWNLDRRLSALTVDNCSTNDKVIEFMLEKLNKNDLLLNGQLYHMRCYAHILNLIVKDGLAVIGDGIERIRDSVAYWVATPKRKERFVEAARQLNIEYKQMLVLDCKTRWNSTYIMLTVASKYKTVFSHLSARDRQYKSVPQEKDWELASKLEDNLRKFYEVTEMFSGTNYPTTNLFFLEVCEIRLSLSDWLTSESEVIRKMAENMIQKHEHYWGVLHGVMAVATILDPRYKLKLIGFYFDSLFGKPDSEFHIRRAFKLCHDLVDEYTLKFKVNEGSSTYGESASSSSSSRLVKSICRSKKQAERLSSFDAYVNETNPIFRSELDAYLDEKILPNTVDFDILTWLKANGNKMTLHASSTYNAG